MLWNGKTLKHWIHISGCLLFSSTHRELDLYAIEWKNGNFARGNLINVALWSASYSQFYVIWNLLSCTISQTEFREIYRVYEIQYKHTDRYGFFYWVFPPKKKEATNSHSTCSQAYTHRLLVTQSHSYLGTHRVSNLDIIIIVIEMMVNWKAYCRMPDTLIEFLHTIGLSYQLIFFQRLV